MSFGLASMGETQSRYTKQMHRHRDMNRNIETYSWFELKWQSIFLSNMNYSPVKSTVSKKGEKWLTCIVGRRPSSVNFCFIPPTPALLINTSNLFSVFIISLANSRTEFSDMKSSFFTITFLLFVSWIISSEKNKTYFKNIFNANLPYWRNCCFDVLFY